LRNFGKKFDAGGRKAGGRFCRFGKLKEIKEEIKGTPYRVIKGTPY